MVVGLKNPNLTSILAYLKRSSQRHLCLAKATSPQSKRSIGCASMSSNVCNSAFLIRRQLIRELDSILLSRSVQREGIARHRSATRQRSTRSNASFLADFLALLVARDQSCVLAWSGADCAVGPHIARDAVNLLQRHIEFIVIGVLKRK